VFDNLNERVVATSDRLVSLQLVCRAFGTDDQRNKDSRLMNSHRISLRACLFSMTMLVPVLLAQDEPRKVGDAPSVEAKAKGKAKAKNKAASKALGPQAKAFQRVVVELDANGDEVLQRSEVPDSARKQFDALLELMDKDGDKALSRSELQASGAKLQAILGASPGAGPLAKDAATKAEMVDPARRLKMMDINSDGKISREEWLGNPAQFDRVDRDGDGSLSKAEQEGAVIAMRRFFEAAKKKAGMN
jgi:Ca2+-binding EF-hand superfamily protein